MLVSILCSNGSWENFTEISWNRRAFLSYIIKVYANTQTYSHKYVCVYPRILTQNQILKSLVYQVIDVVCTDTLGTVFSFDGL